MLDPPHALPRVPRARLLTLETNVTTCVPTRFLLAAMYSPVYRVRDFMALLKQLALLPTPTLAMQAAAALTFNYLTMNTYEFEEQR